LLGESIGDRYRRTGSDLAVHEAGLLSGLFLPVGVIGVDLRVVLSISGLVKRNKCAYWHTGRSIARKVAILMPKGLQLDDRRLTARWLG